MAHTAVACPADPAPAAAGARLPEWQFLVPVTRGNVVTILTGADFALADAARRVGGDDVLYWEIDRRTAAHAHLTPARAHERLGALGLTPCATYWVKPGFPQRRMYLPLESHSALTWYLDTLYRRNTAGRRLLGRGLQAIAARGHLGAVAPCYAVVAARGPHRGPAFHSMAGHPIADAVLLAHGAEEWSRVAILPFDHSRRAPSAVIKLPRNPVFNEWTRWEHQVLRQLHALLPDSLSASLPDSRLIQHGALVGAVEAAVPGASLSTRVASSERNTTDDLALCAGWLEALHTASATHVPARDWLGKFLVDGLCREYEHAFGLTGDEACLFTRLRQHVDALGSAALPLVWQHTDFGPWNVYRDGDRVSVIDWEVARIGPAAADLIYFDTHWNATDPVAGPLREHVAGYMHRLGIDSALLAPLLVYTFVEQTIERVRRLEAAGQRSTDRSSNPYVPYVATMARHARTLFSRGAAS